MMKKYCNKLEVIDAIRWTELNTRKVIEFCEGETIISSSSTSSETWDIYFQKWKESGLKFNRDGIYYHFRFGDWIIRNTNGTFFSLDDEDFNDRYEHFHGDMDVDPTLYTNLDEEIAPELGKIIWNQNPLKSVIELTELGKVYLRLKLKIDHMEDCVVSVIHEASEPDTDIGKLRASVDSELNLDKFEHLTNHTFGWYLNSLSNAHCGDCTCVPASCTKCHAEILLGICTTKGLGKHAANYLNGAFKIHDSIDNALEYLKHYDPTDVQEDLKKHIPRWQEEARRAYEYLLAYKHKRFGGNPKLDTDRQVIYDGAQKLFDFLKSQKGERSAAQAVVEWMAEKNGIVDIDDLGLAPDYMEKLILSTIETFGSEKKQ